MKLRLVVNPTASAVTPKRRLTVEDALASRHDLEVVVTAGRDHATDLAREAAGDGTDAVVVLGGDGTLNEAANGLLDSSTALAPLPGGSTNVFARTIGLPKSLAKATPVLLDALDRDSRRRIDLGTANGRCFLFHVGVGFDAAVVEQVEQRSTLKRKVGQAVFVYATVTTFLRHYDRTRPHFAVRFPGEEEAVDGYFGLCLKTNPYTYFGPRPFDVTSEAGFGKGLAVVVLTNLGFGTLTGAMTSALTGKGRLGARPGVVLRTGLESAVLESDRPFPYQMDGDYIGEVDSLEVGRKADCLDLILPDPT